MADLPDVSGNSVIGAFADAPPNHFREAERAAQVRARGERLTRARNIAFRN
jgi:hypothetical protein